MSKSFHISQIERETTIIFNEEEDMAHVGTCCQKVIRHLEKRCGLTPYRIDGHWRKYSYPKARIVIGPPQKRKISPKHRKRLQQSIVKARSCRDGLITIKGPAPSDEGGATLYLPEKP